MRRYRELILIAALLVAMSTVIFTVQVELFHKMGDTFFYLFQDLAFLPIQVLLVALIIDRLLSRRDKNRLLHKMNMVIGVFFSELGTELLGQLTVLLANKDALRPHLAVQSGWTAADWRRSLRAAATFDYQVDLVGRDLSALRDLLARRRDLLALLLANPNLMEHERFTDLLWAVSHLREELTARGDLAGLPEKDREHLAGDVKRVYSQLTAQWLLYCRHLQKAYPYIFSIIVRMHPLQDSPCATVQ